MGYWYRVLHDGVLICEAVCWWTMEQSFQSRGEAPLRIGQREEGRKGRERENRRQPEHWYVQVVEDEEEEELDRQQELGVAVGRVKLVRLCVGEEGRREGGQWLVLQKLHTGAESLFSSTTQAILPSSSSYPLHT